MTQRHAHHGELVDTAISAFMSVAPVWARVIEVCHNEGWPKPTEPEGNAIMQEAMDFYADKRDDLKRRRELAYGR